MFHAPRLFTTFFALIAISMAASSLLNARIVDRLGTRHVSHSALLAYIAFAVVHVVVALLGYETMWLFTFLMSGLLFCFGLVASNFGSMAMEPLGHLAGTASSVQGFATTLRGAIIGFYVGQSFDGTVVPLTIGIAACGLAGLVVVTITEKGRLFQPTRQTGQSTAFEHFG